MGNAAFLLIAVVLSIVGSLLLWYQTRKTKTFESSIDDFQREMNALGARRDLPDNPRRRLSTRVRQTPSGRN